MNLDRHKRETFLLRNIVIVGEFNTTLTTMDISYIQKNNTETAALKNTPDQMDLIDVYRAFHPKSSIICIFSSAHGAFSRTDHILGHKTSFNKFKKIEIISCIFSDHNNMKQKSLTRRTPKNTQRHGS